jgi:glycosyltransferase involved in cell wall biosynthesis
MHIVHVMADVSTTVPYFNWYAEESHNHPDLKLSFIALTPIRPQMLDDMKERNCDCYWLKYDPRKRKKSLLGLIPQLIRLFKKIRPTIVHTHLFDDSLPSLVAARLAGVKIRVITKGDVGFHYFFTPKWVVLDRFNNWNATHIIALSEESKAFIIKKEKAAIRKITLIHHGIPIAKSTAQSEIKKKELITKFHLRDKIIIGTVSRLIEWKGYRQIIDAVEIVSEKFPNVKFLFIGEGEQKEELLQLIKEKKLGEFILFTQWVERDYIPSLYQIMDIYLHAASFEPFGFALAEAMMNGVPLVSTKTGAALDSIEHLVSGYLVDKTGEDIAKGIFYLLEHDRQKIGTAARLKATQLYPFERMWKNHLLLYSQATKTHAKQ